MTLFTGNSQFEPGVIRYPWSSNLIGFSISICAWNTNRQAKSSVVKLLLAQKNEFPRGLCCLPGSCPWPEGIDKALCKLWPALEFNLWETGKVCRESAWKGNNRTTGRPPLCHEGSSFLCVAQHGHSVQSWVVYMEFIWRLSKTASKISLSMFPGRNNCLPTPQCVAMDRIYNWVERKRLVELTHCLWRHPWQLIWLDCMTV